MSERDDPPYRDPLMEEYLSAIICANLATLRLPRGLTRVIPRNVLSKQGKALDPVRMYTCAIGSSFCVTGLRDRYCTANRVHCAAGQRFPSRKSSVDPSAVITALFVSTASIPRNDLTVALSVAVNGLCYALEYFKLLGMLLRSIVSDLK